MLPRKQESYRRGIVASTVLNIGSKVVAFVNSLVLVYLFGTNAGTDSYFLVISTMGLVSSFLVGIISYVVIPEAMRIRQSKGASAEQAYINFFIFLFLGIGVLIALVVLFNPVLFYSLFSKFSPEQLTAYRHLLALSCLVFPLNLVVNMLVLVLGSHKYFTIPILVALVNSIVSILLLFVLRHYFGVTAAIIAFVTGSAINIIWVVYYFARHLNWSLKKVTYPTKTNWRNILLMEVNLIPISLRAYVTIFMLSGLGAGIISSYNYGMQIAMIPEIMILSQVAAVLAVKYNELSAREENVAIDRLFQKSMRLLFFGLLPIGIILFLLAPEIIHVLFIFKSQPERESLMAIAAFMACYAIILPFRVIDVIISSILMATQKIKEVVIFTISLNCLIVLLIFLSVKWYGLPGFYGCIVFSYAILTPVVFFIFTWKVLPFIQVGKWLKSTTLYFLPLLAIATGLFFLKKYYLVNASVWINIFVITTAVVLTVLLLNRLTRYVVYSLEF